MESCDAYSQKIIFFVLINFTHAISLFMHRSTVSMDTKYQFSGKVTLSMDTVTLSVNTVTLCTLYSSD